MRFVADDFRTLDWLQIPHYPAEILAQINELL